MYEISSYSIKKICTIYGWGNDYRSVYCKNDDGGWVGGHSEIVDFSEIYSVQIHIFDSIASQEPITKVVTADGNYTISILFSGDHYDCLIAKNDDKANRNVDYNVDKEDLKNKSHAEVKELIRNNNLPNYYPTKYSNETLISILEYLKNGKYPEEIEEMRRKKNEIIAKNESTKIKQEKQLHIRRCKEAFQRFSKKRHQA